MRRSESEMLRKLPPLDEGRPAPAVFKPGQALATWSLLTAGIFALDLITPPALDVPILYMFVVLLCLKYPWAQAPYAAAAIAIGLLCIPLALFGSTHLAWSILVNRAITAVALVMTAVLVANRAATDTAVREGHRQLGLRVEARTAELREANRALEAEIAVRRETERSLQESQERLASRDQIRTRFLSVISHELRTPMAAIKGFVDNMLNGITGDLTGQQAAYLTRIRSNIDRLTRLIAQILDWSRLEMDGLPLVRVPISPGDVVKTVCDNAQPIASCKSIVLSADIEPDLPALEADADKVEQMLWNLVGNAIKFTPANGRVVVECRRSGDQVLRFIVHDTGCGILPDQLPKVFDQFSGVTSPVSPARGAQLGLYITKRLVLLHGGRIWVESVVGSGSRFYVDLPLNPPVVQPVPPVA